MEGESAGGRGAVLLTGPLLWDDDPARRAWRDGRLDMARAERVHAPVLHVRSARDGRCTIALAPRGSAEGGGTALVVPLRHALDLRAEAQALWDAERCDDSPGVGAEWGTIGALCPPEGPWRRRWGELVRAGLVALPGRREGTPLGDDGLLDIDWPRAGGGRADQDVILAVVAVPLAAPSEQEVAVELMEDDAARACFHRSRLCGVTTWRDDAIIREMRALVS